MSMEPASPALLPSANALLWTRFAVVLQMCLAAGTAVMAAMGLALRCEGFGCIGQGIYWAAWISLYGVSLMVATWATSRTKRHDIAARLSRSVEIAQWAMGAALTAKWALS